MKKIGNGWGGRETFRQPRAHSDFGKDCIKRLDNDYLFVSISAYLGLNDVFLSYHMPIDARSWWFPRSIASQFFRVRITFFSSCLVSVGVEPPHPAKSFQMGYIPQNAIANLKKYQYKGVDKWVRLKAH